jgi:geranylgeranyl diphosphate synthase type II
MQLDQYMRAHRELVERALDQYLPPDTEPPGRLHEAMRYSALAPGKRLRPILVMASAEAAGADPKLVLPTACALECIHAFSLIHDDMPCMDDDDTRRGRPTSHIVFGEANALLAGDALLAFAFELIASNASLLTVHGAGVHDVAHRVVEAVRLIARASGTWGMVGGQVADMEAEGKDVTPEMLRYIHSHKTGALIEASAFVGAMLVGGDASMLDSLREYGAHLGLAFQIADDILDVVGDARKLGKPVGSDERQNKATYPRLFGIEESRRRAALACDQAVAALSNLDGQADPLRALARYVVERDL